MPKLSPPPLRGVETELDGLLCSSSPRFLPTDTTNESDVLSSTLSEEFLIDS